MATPDGTEGSSEEASQDGGRDFKDVGVELRTWGKYELHDPQETAQEESDGHVDRASAEGEWSNTHAGEAVNNYPEPRAVKILLAYDFVKTLHCLLNAYRIVHHLFVNFMCVSKLAKIHALCSTDYFNLRRMRRLIVKGDDHTAGNVKELAVNFQDSRCHTHVFYRSDRSVSNGNVSICNNTYLRAGVSVLRMS